jgi:hypothetical protein
MRMLPLAVFALGIVTLIRSNVRYYARTKDPKLTRFWLGKDLLSRDEYVANRLGFLLVLVAIALTCVLR